MKFKKYFEMNKNEYIMYQNLWDTVRAVRIAKFRFVNAYVKKQNSQINYRTSHFKTLEKGEYSNLKQIEGRK